MNQTSGSPQLNANTSEKIFAIGHAFGAYLSKYGRMGLPISYESLLNYQDAFPLLIPMATILIVNIGIRTELR